MANWEATFAATEARGPRCDRCDGWTFRPTYNRLPRFVARLCPDCLPLGPKLLPIKELCYCQIFKSDLPKYPAGAPILL